MTEHTAPFSLFKTLPPISASTLKLRKFLAVLMHLSHLHVMYPRDETLTLFGVFAGTERKLQLWTVLPSGERQGGKIPGRRTTIGRLSIQRTCGLSRGKCFYTNQCWIPNRIVRTRQTTIYGTGKIHSSCLKFCKTELHKAGSLKISQLTNKYIRKQFSLF